MIDALMGGLSCGTLFVERARGLDRPACDLCCCGHQANHIITYGNMDSFVIQPTYARMAFAMMLTERMDQLEDVCRSLTETVSQLQGALDAMPSELDELLRTAVPQLAPCAAADACVCVYVCACHAGPLAYYIVLDVPAGTTSGQVEDGLKATWTRHGLSTDGCNSTVFCVVVTRECRRSDRSLVSTRASIFIDSCQALTPSQAMSWATAAVPGSRLALRHHMHCICDTPRADYFRWQLEGQQAWCMDPGSSSEWEQCQLEAYAGPDALNPGLIAW